MWTSRTSLGRRVFPLSWVDIPGTAGGCGAVVEAPVAGTWGWVWELVAAGAEVPFVAEDSAGGVRGCVVGAWPCGWLGDAILSWIADQRSSRKERANCTVAKVVKMLNYVMIRRPEKCSRAAFLAQSSEARKQPKMQVAFNV